MRALNWLAIAGPTACGKTALALAISTRWPVEIISVDSALVYRGMDIGTAKPSAAELCAVPHHLIDVLEPTQAYSAATFTRDATRLVHAIRSRGRLPLLVGGTMLYFKALFEGLDDLPAAQPGVRAELERQAQEQGWPALHAELARVDPASAARLAPMDAQRIGRALEVYRSTGLPISALQQRHRRQSVDEPLHIDGLRGELWTLEPTDRSWLHERIAKRFDAMLDAGFLQEMQTLRSRGDLSLHLPAMRCVGYRQAWEALDQAAASGQPALSLAALDELRQRGVAATRQLAKRQLTWLRSMPQRHIWACDDPSSTELALQALALAMAQGGPGGAGTGHLSRPEHHP